MPHMPPRFTHLLCQPDTTVCSTGIARTLCRGRTSSSHKCPFTHHGLPPCKQASGLDRKFSGFRRYLSRDSTACSPPQLFQKLSEHAVKVPVLLHFTRLRIPGIPIRCQPDGQKNGYHERISVFCVKDLHSIPSARLMGK